MCYMNFCFLKTELHIDVIETLKKDGDIQIDYIKWLRMESKFIPWRIM